MARNARLTAGIVCQQKNCLVGVVSVETRLTSHRRKSDANVAENGLNLGRSPCMRGAASREKTRPALTHGNPLPHAQRSVTSARVSLARECPSLSLAARFSELIARFEWTSGSPPEKKKKREKKERASAEVAVEDNFTALICAIREDHMIGANRLMFV
jgi:hypothetical protein